MPYRIPYKPKQRPPWDMCLCTFTYIGGIGWKCCRCSEYKKVVAWIDQYATFCPECGHARNLRAGETEDDMGPMFVIRTNSGGPR